MADGEVEEILVNIGSEVTLVLCCVNLQRYASHHPLLPLCF